MGAEVVAVAVDGLGVVDPDPRLRALGEAAEEADRPLGQRAGVGRDDHHLVADRLHDRRLGGQRRLDRVDEVLDDVERLEVALFLGVAGEPGEVDEAEGDRDVVDLRAGVAELALHVADDVLLEEEAKVASVEVLGQRGRHRQDVAGQLADFLRHLELGDGVADQRLVDVEVEEADLGVGDPPDRLDVDAHQLQEGDEREAGGEDAGAVPHRADVLGAEEPLRPSGVPRMTRIRSISSGSSPVSSETSSIVTCCSVAAREELLGEAEREPPLTARFLQLLERVAALAHPGDDARLGGRGRGPTPAPDRDDLLRRPAFQRRGRDARPARGLTEADPLFRHWSENFRALLAAQRVRFRCLLAPRSGRGYAEAGGTTSGAAAGRPARSMDCSRPR